MRIRILPAVAAVAFSALFVFNSCVKDKCTQMHRFTYFEPIYKTKDEVRNNIKSNPAREVVNTGKFCILGNYIFLNEIDKGIHVIDNSDPAHPVNKAFIDIPGNMDIAVKDNILYADLYTDLVAIDISNPASVVVKKIINNLFPNRWWYSNFSANNNAVIVDWRRVDTTVKESCQRNWNFVRSDVLVFSTAQAGFSTTPSLIKSGTGVGGSMARFTIMNNRLYTVNTSDLDVFNITNGSDPVHSNSIHTGNWNIETIYPFKNKLFIGSQTGMFVYTVVNPDNPVQSGQFNHVRTCDPVIADDDYAFVTLSSGSTCMGFNNELDVLKLNNFTDPQLLKVYPLTNPKGLSKSGNYLFICDGSAGLKVYNASDVMNLQLIKTISGIDAYDVVAYDNKALVVAKDGLYQYNYTDINNISLLSKISVNK